METPADQRISIRLEFGNYSIDNEISIKANMTNCFEMSHSLVERIEATKRYGFVVGDLTLT